VLEPDLFRWSLPMKRAVIAASAAFALALGVGAAIAQQGSLPLLLQTALNPPAASAGQLYAYDFVSVSKGDEPSTVRGRIDPSQPEGKRVTIIEAVGEKVDAKKIDRRMEENADGDIWCDRMTGGVDGAVAERPAPAGLRAYAFTPKAKADAKAGERKLYQQLTAEVQIDEQTQRIRRFVARLNAPWKPVVVVKIDSLEMTGDCVAAPNGRAYTASTRTVVSGSALGSDFDTEFSQTISNLREVR
jgi:hypothetical protein